MKKLIIFTLALFALTTQAASAALNTLACEPEWGALLKELGGNDVKVYVATNAMQDPHHIEARPSLIARVRNADLLVCTGAELEIGWLPLLLQQASRRVQPGQPGYFEASSVIRLREIPSRLDRAMGDVHPEGNPHIQTDPRNIARVAQALATRLQEVDPAHAQDYRARYADFSRRWQAAIARWETEAAPLKGMPIVVHHDGWVYLERWLGLKQLGTLEPLPGVPPTTEHVLQLLNQLKRTPARAIVYAPFDDTRADQWLAKQTGTPAVLLPFTVGGTPGAKDLFGLFDDTIARLLAAERAGK